MTPLAPRRLEPTMTGPQPEAPRRTLRDTSLDDKYTLLRGRAFMTGTQALVRLALLQRRRDLASGLNTAGLISGYRGSPLGGLDLALWSAKDHLEAHHVRFQPGVNEELSANAIWGAQQVNLYPGARYDGVFGLWYGKGPGVDRSGDVLKHANAAGTSPRGGVVVLAGDDHGAKSSTLPHQSDPVLIACGIPVLYPATVQEYLDLGLHAFAMSRYAGLWVAMKCVTDVVESSGSIEVDMDRITARNPGDFVMPPGGLNLRWPDTPLEQEERLLRYKIQAAEAYTRENRLDRAVIDPPGARFGILTSGKSYGDVRRALDDLGLNEGACARVGLRVYKVGVVWPLEQSGVRRFAEGLEEILVVEEKRPLLEHQLKAELYNAPAGARPRVVGKLDEPAGGGPPDGPGPLLPAHHELHPGSVARAIAGRLSRLELDGAVRARMEARIAALDAAEAALSRAGPAAPRRPYFCSGCPHSVSTRVPEGSRAMAGIGCHFMAIWMDRSTSTFSQMGGEGAAWIGQAPFTEARHVFANLGDGTYYHSGSMAIRAAVAAGVPITYKILVNDAVAMTGGQPVDGDLTVPAITRQVAAERVERIAVVTDDPERYRSARDLAPGTTVHHRDDLDAVQRALREHPGVSVLVYDQTCAAEVRRRRKRDAHPDPLRRVIINELVCEGCGDCSVQSNCLSIEAIDTELGRKRAINQSSCNKDFSCLKGLCPSFVTVEGGRMRKGARRTGAEAAPPDLPEPACAAIGDSGRRSYKILIAGIGGTGVVTIGALLGMAAHLEGKGVSVLDVAGLAQKGGAVFSHVQIAEHPDALHTARLAAGEADLVLGCDLVVAAGLEALSRVRAGVTRAAVNLGETPTADLIRDPGWRAPAPGLEAEIRAALGGEASAEHAAFVDATRLATSLMGDAITSNLFLLGFAWQRGWIPLSREALLRAIELNGVAVEQNRQAFLWGRRAAHDREAVTRVALPVQLLQLRRPSVDLDALIARRVEFLCGYQSAAYAERYRALVARVRAAEAALTGSGARLALTEAVARYHFKLMAYKDEYEVARLLSDPSFLDRVREQFEGEPRLSFHLAPPQLARRGADGRPVKRTYGAWFLIVLKVLAALKLLRGTPLDLFGRSEERRAERALIREYEATIEALLARLSAENLALAVEIAKIPEEIRGYSDVKSRSVLAARERWSRMLARWRGEVDDGAIAPMEA
jgi:indolepyruvate ferredoxin oxidoreductase